MVNIPKFKAWCLKTNKMHNVKGISFDYREIVIKRSAEKIAEIKAAGDHYCTSCDEVFDDFLKLDECILLPWTEFRDRNRNDVYLDNILSFTDSSNKEIIGVVTRRVNGKWVLVPLDSPAVSLDIHLVGRATIIGTRQENPEILYTES